MGVGESSTEDERNGKEASKKLVVVDAPFWGVNKVRLLLRHGTSIARCEWAASHERVTRVRRGLFLLTQSRP